MQCFSSVASLLPLYNLSKCRTEYCHTVIIHNYCCSYKVSYFINWKKSHYLVCYFS
uniref:Uncharacterized protein n=1 Tax=Anguilla anguilla TaxID=7936 RepID=A0A0E9X452_ANGAN